jgi:hypothetical protein
MEDSKDGEASICRVENPITGSCTCPVGSSHQKFRVIGQNGVATTVFLCGPKLIRSNLVQLCPGVSVDNTGITPIGDALAQCLFLHPNFLQPLDIPAGIYLMDKQITLRGQLRTAGADLAGNHLFFFCLAFFIHTNASHAFIICVDGMGVIR